MKKQLKKFFSQQRKLRAIHPDDPWNEIKLAHKYKKKKRKKICVDFVRYKGLVGKYLFAHKKKFLLMRILRVCLAEVGALKMYSVVLIDKPF